MRPEDVPSLYRALAIRFARKLGVDPDHLEGVACGQIEDVKLAMVLVTKLWALVDPRELRGLGSLTSDTESATTDTVTQAQIDTPSKIRGPLPYDHPFANALRARGISVAEWARKHRIKDSKVKSWLRSVDPRTIPRKTAVAIEKELNVPLSAWKNGIRD